MELLIEAGLIDFWFSKIRPNSSNCDTKAKILATHERPLVQLTLGEMKHFFFIIFVGLIISVVGLLTEIIKAKVERYQDRNRQGKILAGNLPRERPPQQDLQAPKTSGPTQRPFSAKFRTRTPQPSSYVLRGKVAAQCFLSRLILELDEGAALQKNTKYPRLQILR